MNQYGYLAWDGDLDPKWDMNFDLQIEKTDLNKKIYPQLVRQLEILKWLCSKNDIFYTMDKHIQFMDKIYNVFNGTKKEFFEAKKLNEKKQKYYLHKFLFKQDLDLDGNILNARPIDDNRKDDLCYLVRHKIDPINVSPGNYAFFDYSSICWNCGNDVFHTEQHKICIHGVTYQMILNPVL